MRHTSQCCMCKVLNARYETIYGFPAEDVSRWREDVKRRRERDFRSDEWVPVEVDEDKPRHRNRYRKTFKTAYHQKKKNP